MMDAVWRDPVEEKGSEAAVERKALLVNDVPAVLPRRAAFWKVNQYDWRSCTRHSHVYPASLPGSTPHTPP